MVGLCPVYPRKLTKDFQTLPPDRMKAGREHPVPLSERAAAILRQLAEARTGDFVFPGQRKDRPMAHTAMNTTLCRMKADTVTVHGFRSSFRDWAGNETSYPRDLIETALAHVVGDAAEQAYRRSDALEKRRKLMEAWSAYCEPKASGNIVQINKRKSL